MGWLSEPTYIQTEPDPQWNTAGIGSSIHSGIFGPGTADTVAYPYEKSPARCGITQTTEMFSRLTGLLPTRVDMAVSDKVQLFEDVPQHNAHRIFKIQTTYSNPDQIEGAYLTLFLSNGMDIVSQDEYDEIAISTSSIEDVACALEDPAAETSKLLTFWQEGGVVNCTTVIAAPESKNRMSYSHYTYIWEPVTISAMETGSTAQVATGGMVGQVSPWTNWNYAGDLFFSSIQAINVGGNRVLMLHLKANGNVEASIVTLVNDTPVVQATATVATGVTNIYQVVPSNDDISQVAFTYRSGTTGGAVVISTTNGSITITGSTSLDTDFSHITWCKDRIVILTKEGYSAEGGDAVLLGWDPSPVYLSIYDKTLGQLIYTTRGDQGLIDQIWLTGSIQGFSDGRLFMNAAAYNPVPVDNDGHEYRYDGSGIRLFVLENDTLILQDQISEIWRGVASQDMHRIGDDVVIVCGRTDTVAGPPGNEQPSFQLFFIGGIMKEWNPDSELYRLNDEWLYTIEVEKNGSWFSAPNVVTGFGSGVWEFNSYYARAIHIDSNGIPDMVGTPVWMGSVHNYYNGSAPLDDTHILFASLSWPASITPQDHVNTTAHFSIQTLELDESNGDLSIVHTYINDSFLNAVGDSHNGIIWDLAPLEEGSNIYAFLYGKGSSGFRPLWISSIRRESDGNWTLLDDQLITEQNAGPGFPQRKPYGLVRLDSNKFIATWVNDIGNSHWSSHTGILFDSSGQITLGESLIGGSDKYGYQGVWMYYGGVVGGRYLYPCAEHWLTNTDRFPNIPHESGSFSFIQKKPYAIAAMEVSDSDASIDVKFYPLRVIPSDDEMEWYIENQFFAPEPEFINPTPRNHQAHPDGYLYSYYNAGQVISSDTDGEFWLYDGPQPTPWVLDLLTTPDGMAKYVIDEENSEAVYVSGTWDQFDLGYYSSYGSHAVELRSSLVVCLTNLSYFCRATPQGYEGGFGTGTIRVFDTGGRGKARPGAESKRSDRVTMPVRL